MRQKKSKISVKIVGTRWLRFLITNDRQQFWAGSGWADRRSGALWYAHVDVIREDVARLKRQPRDRGGQADQSG